MDLYDLQYQLSQASLPAQAALAAPVLLLMLLSTWFWSMALDRLFDRIGQRLFKGRGTAPQGGRT